MLDKTRNVVKILVREYSVLCPCRFAHQMLGSESNEVHSVKLDGQKSDAEYTQLLWDLASS